MGCCGGNKYKVRRSAPNIQKSVPPKTSPVSGAPETLRNRTAKVGSVCIYCGNKITVKVKRVSSGWDRVYWCPICRLEVSP